MCQLGKINNKPQKPVMSPSITPQSLESRGTSLDTTYNPAAMVLPNTFTVQVPHGNHGRLSHMPIRHLKIVPKGANTTDKAMCLLSSKLVNAAAAIVPAKPRIAMQIKKISARVVDGAAEVDVSGGVAGAAGGVAGAAGGVAGAAGGVAGAAGGCCISISSSLVSIGNAIVNASTRTSPNTRPKIATASPTVTIVNQLTNFAFLHKQVEQHYGRTITITQQTFVAPLSLLLFVL